MTVLQQISNPYFASLVLGLLYGLIFCTSVCLPYVISYIVGIGAGFRKGITVTSIYNSGRIAAYAIIGAITGVLKTVVSEDFFLSYQSYSDIAFGAVIMIIGISILLKKSNTETCVGKEPRVLSNSLLTISTWK